MKIVRTVLPAALCWVAILMPGAILRRGWLFWLLVLPAGINTVWSNRKRFWVWLAASGALLNVTVCLVNGGCMPVRSFIPRLDGYTHCLATQATHLLLLGDNIGSPNMIMVSIGDLIIIAGILWWLALKFFNPPSTTAPAPPPRGHRQ